MGSYEYLEDEAIADVAFKAYGDDIEDLFLAAGMATASLQTDISKLTTTEERELRIEKSDYERLLKAFLSEILFYKDAELLFATGFEVSIQSLNEGYLLIGKLLGGIFDPEKHPMHNDLKAITWHDFSVNRNTTGWECYVLIDI